jgi:ubiquitin carboxyl-terminal hydrolase 16
MDIWRQIKWLITDKNPVLPPPPPSVIPVHSSSYLPDFVVNFWSRKDPVQQRVFLAKLLIAIATSYYILAPTLFPSQQMFSKRPDRYTTGLINLRNDCFANASLQAYSSLPGLTEYLNDIVKSYHLILDRLHYHGISVETLEKARKSALNHGTGHNNSKFDFTTFDIPLHISLAQIIRKLQETQMTTRTISVWPFLHQIEKIFNAKISRSQHDAHELTQLINETLENENLKLKSFHNYLKKNLHELLGVSNPPLPQDYTKLIGIQVVEFPFCGLILNQMQCLQCQNVSKPSLAPFLMLTLPTPQLLQTDLETIIHDNRAESIEGYQCIRCRVGKIVENEDYVNRKLDDKTAKFIADIRKLNQNRNLFINEDLPEDLENFIKNYNVRGVDMSKVTSTVFRKLQILKPPKVFGLHLSRSTFDGVNFTRNPCRVSFQDRLKLSIGKEYHEELRKFQDYRDELDRNDDMNEVLKSTKILTTDVNDMEDEDVQREDIDEKGSEDAALSEGYSDVDDENDDDVSLNEVTAPSKIESIRTLNNTPISADQTDSLRQQFEQFKFNDNDVYKYRLKAIIRHLGSHTQGHYECFKHKPLYVKDKEGNILKLSPGIQDETIEENYEVSGEKPEQQNHVSQIFSPGPELEDSGLRKKFSDMMGRRPSIYHADPEYANLQEVIQSGMQSPNEVTINQPNIDLITKALGESNEIQPQKSDPVKMKKIPSLIKNPFWRISDSHITEVSRSTVLNETSTVYMLYYERIDSK